MTQPKSESIFSENIKFWVQVFAFLMSFAIGIFALAGYIGSRFDGAHQDYADLKATVNANRIHNDSALTIYQVKKDAHDEAVDEKLKILSSHRQPKQHGSEYVTETVVNGHVKMHPYFK